MFYNLSFSLTPVFPLFYLCFPTFPHLLYFFNHTRKLVRVFILSIFATFSLIYFIRLLSLEPIFLFPSHYSCYFPTSSFSPSFILSFILHETYYSRSSRRKGVRGPTNVLFMSPQPHFLCPPTSPFFSPFLPTFSPLDFSFIHQRSGNLFPSVPLFIISFILLIYILLPFINLPIIYVSFRLLLSFIFLRGQIFLSTFLSFSLLFL